jgi:hypothetical protein
MKAVNHPEEFNNVLPWRKINKHVFNPKRICIKRLVDGFSAKNK